MTERPEEYFTYKYVFLAWNPISLAFSLISFGKISIYTIPLTMKWTDFLSHGSDIIQFYQD